MTWFWLILKPAISCIEKFLCHFVHFYPIWPICPFLPVLYITSGTTGDNKQSGNPGNYNIYSNGQSQKFLNVMTWFWLIPKHAISCIEKFLCVLVRFCAFWQICPFLPVLNTSSETTGDNKQPGKSDNYNIFSNG